MKLDSPIDYNAQAEAEVRKYMATCTPQAPQILQTIPGCCQSCGRHLLCPQNKIPPTIKRDNPQDPRINALFILPSPDIRSAEKYQTFFSQVDKAAELFTEMMSRLHINYAIMGACQCGGDSPPNAHELGCCFPSFGEDLIQHLNPQVIVLMGEGPRDAILGTGVSIKDAHKQVFKFQRSWGEVSCLLAPDPRTQFFAKGATDLRPVLGEVYELVDQIVKGTYEPFSIGHWVDIDGTNAKTAMWKYKQFVENLEPVISLDFEFDTSDSNEETIWEEGKGAPVCCQSGGWNPTTLRYETCVMRIFDWETDDIAEFLRLAFLGKTLVGSWFKIDVQCGWVNTAEVIQEGPWAGNFANGVDVLNFCRGWEDGHYVQYLDDQSVEGSGLKPRCMKAFGWPDWSLFFKDALNRMKASRGKGHDITSNVLWPTVALYGATDAYAEIKWWREKAREILPRVRMAYDEIKETTHTLMGMERTGIKVNAEGLERYKHKLEGEIASLQTWLDQHPYVKAAGLTNFNAKSAPQVTAVCRANGIKTDSTETGLAAVNGQTLPHLTSAEMELRKTDEEHFFGIILDQRQKRDMISRSILPWQRYQTNGWAHPTYAPSKTERATGKDQGAVTGRKSAFRPAADQMVKDNEYRENFPAPDGHVIAEFDFKTGEPVINGYLSKCPALINMFELGAREPTNPYADPYRVFMADRLGRDAALLTKSERDMGKIPWLAGTYGQSPETIAKDNGISVEEAEQMLFRFYSMFPELLQREAEVRRKLFSGEMFTTCVGRRRSFPLFRKYNYNPEKYANWMTYQVTRELRLGRADSETLRQAGNNEIQGPLGIITFYAMNYIERVKHQAGHDLSPIRLWLSVHDSMAFYIPEDNKLLTRIQTISKLMSSYWLYLPREIIDKLGLPTEFSVLRNDWKVGSNYGDMVGEEKALKGEWEWIS